MDKAKIIDMAKVAGKALLKVVLFLAEVADRSIVRILNRR